jgi:sugar phosphate isomerase/epimerase
LGAWTSAAGIMYYWGWRMVFVATGAIGFLWLLLWALVYRPLATPRWVTDRERRHIEEGQKDLAVAEPPPEAFEALDGLCQEYKINLAVHNHPEGSGSKYWNPDTLIQACEGRSARIGGCPDTGHWVRSGLDTLASLRKYQQRIITIHLKDAAESGKRDSRDVPLGTGQGNYAALLKQLYDWKWRGVMTVEYEFLSPQLVQDVAQCVKFVEDFATSVRK